MSKSDLLLESLNRFFSVAENENQLHDILEHRKGISLRNLEWFVTNYSKTKHVTYTAPNGKIFTVHVAYKSSLDGYSKKLFDPFCRTERIQFKGITTTVAQLNFIRWCITNGIIEYILREKAVLRNHSETEEQSIHSKRDTSCTPEKSENCILVKMSTTSL
jgi:hypothetical protein